jgi:nicotinamidase-related amidase
VQALLVIDFQRAIFELPVPVHDPDGTTERMRALVERARAAGTPIAYFCHIGKDGSLLAMGAPGREIHPAVAPRPEDTVFDKREPDMFLDSPLADWLAARGVTEVVIAGFATEYCVDTTVRSAFSRGLQVVLAAGANTTTENGILAADQIVRHTELTLARFARVVPAAEVVFAER